jgi:two-component system, OmpR family, phosphate regulon sensor histidine kinase PhoR
MLDSSKHKENNKPLASRRKLPKLDAVLNELADGFILADRNMCLLSVNHAARMIFNVGNVDVAGKPVDEVFTHPDLLDIFRPYRNMPFKNEITIEDGRVFSALASELSNIGLAVVLHDITRLKELDRTKTDFVNTVSHDLRSPLTAVYGFIGLIDRVGPVNQQQAEFIRHIQASLQNITSLINDLLDLGRIEASQDQLMVEVDLKDIIKQVLENLEYQSSEKLQEINLSLPDDLPPVLGYPLHLQRMLGNLVENAIKFTQLAGKIEIRCRTEANQIFLEVADNGPGIPLEDQPHVFDKFYRGSNISEVTNGTGLGLSIVKSIVDRHQGRIWLESSPQGTTFTVILPTK